MESMSKEQSCKEVTTALENDATAWSEEINMFSML
jgi:hypothetical protein